MQRQVVFAIVSILLYGPIHSAVITPATTSPPEKTTQDTPTTSPPEKTTQDTPALATTAAPVEEIHYYHDNNLKVDGSNPILGDIPIFEDNEIDIINRKNVPLRNCKELKDDGFTKSGLYVVQPGKHGGEFVVYCDMTLLDGGWTVIQRRLNSKLSFDRTYSSYRNGFGDFTENFWLGLDKINRLTQTSNSNGPMEVYFGVKAFFDYSTFSRYSQFSVGTEGSGYKLTIGGHDRTSSAGDSMSFYNNQKFSTRDKDQDNKRSPHCYFNGYKGGWWFRDCVYTNLNGMYYDEGRNRNVHDGISWRSWLGTNYSLKNTVIAIRPAH